MTLSLDLDALDFTKGGGLVSVVAQHAGTNAVLMIAFADREALERTLATGDMHFRSRTRGLWRKGETSGNVLAVHSLLPDCDGDAILARVIPRGPACHTGAPTCFGEPVLDGLSTLEATLKSRASASPDDPATASSYTTRLLADRNLRLKKIGEEAAELIVALVDRDAARAAEEAADLLYHALVGLTAVGVTMDDIRAVLAARANK